MRNPHREGRCEACTARLIWYRLTSDLRARYVRTTPRGDIIDTVFVPLAPMHSNNRMTLASGPYSPSEEAPGAIVRQRYRNAPRNIPPASLPLGRCNAMTPLM